MKQALYVALALVAVVTVGSSAAPRQAQAARYNVVCIAPNGSWCRIACSSNRGVACYANVINGQCVKRCSYR